VGPQNIVLDGGPDPPLEEALLRGHVLACMYLYTTALRIVCLPSLMNMSAQRTWRTNTFTAMRGDKTAMQPFAKITLGTG